MRLLPCWLVILIPLTLLACGTDGTGGPGPGDDDDDDGVPEPESFEIVTPEITLAPGEEKTYCYYTTVPVDADVAVKRWESHMTPGSHHLILYFTATEVQPDGTLTEDCGGGVGGVPVWTYSTQSADDELNMPTDVGMKVAAGQKAYVQMHYLNAGESELRANVRVKGEAYARGASYIPAAPFITFNTGIHVPPGESSSVEGSCAVPADAKFFVMGTHAHRFATRTEVHDGSSMIFESEDWEHPGGLEWLAEPFYRFQSELRYRCEYYNFTSQPVRTGDSAATDEMCMAVGYFFPAPTGAKFCLDSNVIN